MSRIFVHRDTSAKKVAPLHGQALMITEDFALKETTVLKGPKPKSHAQSEPIQRVLETGT